MWNNLIEQFESFLRIEKSLSERSVEAYRNDVYKLTEFLSQRHPAVTPSEIQMEDLRQFISHLHDLGIGNRTQARIISGIKAFFQYLVFDNQVDSDPAQLLEIPRIERKLPEVLTVEEIDHIQQAIDLSQPEGHRNKAIVEVLYSCGLRVSELIHLRLSDLYKQEKYIWVRGKGKKERLVPISDKALNEIDIYIQKYRNHLTVKTEDENVLFLNRRGNKLTRVMIFTIIKRLAAAANLSKQVSPHSFRHSFASHLVDAGADLRAVQEMLGHESIMTTEIYTHLDQHYLRDMIIQYHPRSKLNRT